jgi:site-specific recombinase XerD
MERIRGACRTAREKALVEVLNSTWCRVSEAIQLRRDAISGGKAEIIGKGNKARTVYLDAKAAYAVEMYLAERQDNNPYVFPRAAHACDISSFQGKGSPPQEWYKAPEMVDPSRPMSCSSAENVIRMIGKRAGVENVHPHRFRRTGATMALRHGMPLTSVSKILGHESIATTQIYLDVMDEELENAHKKFTY